MTVSAPPDRRLGGGVGRGLTISNVFLCTEIGCGFERAPTFKKRRTPITLRTREENWQRLFFYCIYTSSFSQKQDERERKKGNTTKNDKYP